MIIFQKKFFRLSKTGLSFLFGLFLCCPIPTFGVDIKEQYAGSIIQKVIDQAELHKGYIDEYEAQAYIKGISNTLKKNILFRIAPDFFAADKKNNQTILETFVDVHYKSPNIFYQKIKAAKGTTSNTDDLQALAIKFLNVNVYNPTALDEEILMPLSRNAFKYYRFSHLSTNDSLGFLIHKIKVEPQINSQKLISGTISVIDSLWILSSMDIHGKWDFYDFNFVSNFGLTHNNVCLPVKTNLWIKINILGNNIENQYFSEIKYTNIIKNEKLTDRKHLGYDLTNYFNIKSDLKVNTDSTFWENNRPAPLSIYEKNIYETYTQKSELATDSSSLKTKKSWDVTRGIISPKNFNYEDTKFRYSGLLNPLKLAYSGLDGFVYWQQLKLFHNFESGEAISFSPDIGFVFKRKEIFFTLPLNWLYQPKKMGEISLSIGNRNNSYNSKVIEEINKELKDSTFNFNDLNLEYYRHYYTALNNRYELFNGFLFDFGIDYHFYQPSIFKKTNNPDIVLKSDLKELINSDYISFSPTLGFTYTPKQYYRINKNRKEYISSKYPTFSFEYSRGIPDIINSNSNYERIEGDIQQRINLGLLRSFRYYAGAGIFTNTKSVYFADFNKFAKRNFPRSWDDQMGGVFHLLDGAWYNASDSYVQAHLMYESPFFLLRFFKRISKEVLRERIYLGQLFTPVLPSYTEMGYAFGNYIFSAGIFVGFEKGKYHNFGFKLDFEIGK